MKFLGFIFIVILTNIKICSATTNRIRGKIYEDLKSNFTCFRRMNATHQIGCTSDGGGNVGIIHLIENQRDIDWLIDVGQHPPYVPVFIIPSLFSKSNMIKLKDSKKINGVLVMFSKNITADLPDGFSIDSSCPNDNFGLYTKSKNTEYANCEKTKWNPENLVSDMMFEDWGFPISLVKEDKDIQSIKTCFHQFNKPVYDMSNDRPFCAVEFKSAMMAAKDTPTCMRRSHLVTNMDPSVICDPLGDKNIYSFLYHNDNVTDRSIIVVAARLDSFSLFTQASYGGDSSITGAVTLISVAATLSKVRDEFMKLTKNKTNVLFVLFNGEAFDYIGSSRMVYDILKRKLPFNLSHISHFIELNQMHADDEYWIHTDPFSLKSTSQSVDELYKELRSNGAEIGVNISRSSKDLPLPPSSLQSFLLEDENITGIVLSNFDRQFANRYYNSMYDTAGTLGYNRLDAKFSSNIAKIVAVVAKTIFYIGTNRKLDVKVDENLVNETLFCYFVSPVCDMFKMSLPSSQIKYLSKVPYDLYVSVSTSTNHITVVTSHLLHYLTGTIVNVTDCEDSGGYTYKTVSGPDMSDTEVCVRSLVKEHDAISPAFEEKDWTSTRYSTWTESRWNSFSIRMFLKPSLSHEVMTLCVGISVFVVSLIFVYFVSKKSDTLFGAASDQMFSNAVPC
ncbi:NCSTN (predicted) [Pycnogonum litorale]